jgi:hypothetical protein
LTTWVASRDLAENVGTTLYAAHAHAAVSLNKKSAFRKTLRKLSTYAPNSRRRKNRDTHEVSAFVAAHTLVASAYAAQVLVDYAAWKSGQCSSEQAAAVDATTYEARTCVAPTGDFGECMSTEDERACSGGRVSTRVAACGGGAKCCYEPSNMFL